MKIQPAQADKFVQQPDSKVQAVLVYGPNYGLAHEYAVALLGRHGGDVTELRASDIADDSTVLHDAAYASSLFGGGAPVFVRDGADRALASVPDLLKEADSQRNFIVIEAGELTNKSKLRLFFEAEPHLASIACYAETGEQLAKKLRDIAAENGARIADEAMDYIIERLPGDRAAQRQEIEKLLLYVGQGNPVTLKDAMATIGDAADVDAFELPWLVFSGEISDADRAMRRLMEEDQSAIGILRMLISHAIKIQAALAMVEQGKTASAATDSMRPPIFYNQKSKFQSQLRRWSLPSISRAITTLNEYERLCKSTGYPANTLTRQLAAQLVQRAV